MEYDNRKNAALAILSKLSRFQRRLVWFKINYFRDLLKICSNFGGCLARPQRDLCTIMLIIDSDKLENEHLVKHLKEHHMTAFEYIFTKKIKIQVFSRWKWNVTAIRIRLKSACRSQYFISWRNKNGFGSVFQNFPKNSNKKFRLVNALFKTDFCGGNRRIFQEFVIWNFEKSLKSKIKFQRFTRIVHRKEMFTSNFPPRWSEFTRLTIGFWIVTRDSMISIQDQFLDGFDPDGCHVCRSLVKEESWKFIERFRKLLHLKVMIRWSLIGRRR